MGSEHEDGRRGCGEEGKKRDPFLIWLEKGFGRTAGVRDERLLPSVSVRNLAFCMARSRKRAKAEARALFATHFLASLARPHMLQEGDEGAHFPGNNFEFNPARDAISLVRQRCGKTGGYFNE